MDVVIRTATPTDGPAVAAIYAPYVRDTVVTFELEPPSPDAMSERIRDVLERFPWVVAQRGDALVGFAYASEHRGRPAYRWSCEVSVYVAPKQHRQGIGRRLYTNVFATLERMNYRRVYAGVAGVNPKSVGLHEALGFESVGIYRGVGFKHHAWHDTHWFQRTLGSSHAPPAGEPIPFPEL